MIASHYAEPLERKLAKAAKLFEAPADDSVPLADLQPGTILRILDRRSGWAWGYADGLVGYIPAAALSA